MDVPSKHLSSKLGKARRKMLLLLKLPSSKEQEQTVLPVLVNMKVELDQKNPTLLPTINTDYKI